MDNEYAKRILEERCKVVSREYEDELEEKAIHIGDAEEIRMAVIDGFIDLETPLRMIGFLDFEKIFRHAIEQYDVYRIGMTGYYYLLYKE